jgi:two-component system response regulator MtrA
MKVLLVDDDVDLLDVTSYALRREGFNLIMATNGAQALRRWETDEPDVVVLDVNLPKLSGFEVLRKIAQAETSPVIMLTALGDDENVVKGFRLGADDYVTKPFSPRQLAMRIRAVARRGARSDSTVASPELRVGDMVLDIEAHEVRVGTRLVRLTPLEFRILHLLANNLGRVVGSARLVEYAWGYDGADIGLLKTHVCHIRQKLSLPKGQLGDILAVPGVGYRLTHREGTAPAK